MTRPEQLAARIPLEVDDAPDAADLVADDAPTPFAGWLRRELRASRMSQRQLARRSGVNHSTISRLLSDPREPSYRTAYRLARTLGALHDAPPIDWDETALAAGPSVVARVEYALRADALLRSADVRELMRGYLRVRTRRLATTGRAAIRLRRIDDLEEP